MPTSNFQVRLGIKGDDAVKRAFASTGAAGDKFSKQIESATQRPSRALVLLNQSMRGVNDQAQLMASRAGPAGAALQALGAGGLAAAAGIGALVAGLGVSLRAARQSIETFDKLDDSAQRIGVSAEAFQELNFAFGQVGVNAEKSERALIKFNDSIGEIVLRGAEAPKELQVAFNAVGVSVEDVQARADDLPGLLAMVSDGLQGMGSQAERTAALTAIFGRGAADILPLLSQGSDAIDRYTRMAHELGAVLDNETVQALSTAGDRLAELENRWDVQVAKLTAGMVPAIVDTKAGIVELLTEINELIGSLPEAERFWQAFTDAAFRPLGPIRSILESLGILEGKLNQVQRGATGSWGSPAPTDDRGLVITGIQPNSIIPSPRPDRPGTPARQQPGFFVPRPTPRYQPEPIYPDYGTASPLDFSPLSSFELSDPNKSFMLTDEMITRLEEGKTAYEDLTEANTAFEQAALNTAGILSQSFGDFFTDLVLEGRGSVEDLMKEIQRLIIRMFIAMAIQRALGAALGGGAGGGGAGMAIASGLQMGVGAAFGPPGGGGGQQQYAYGSTAGYQFHSGRGPGEFGAPRLLPAGVFDTAPRLHRGRFASNEIPAVITREESVLTPGQMRTISSPTVNMPVHIHNNAGASVQTQRRSDGGLDVIIDQVEEAMAGRMMRQGSKLNRAYRSANQTQRR